jgi:NAD(P)-dependent dehydrogenase (short-subunit alcohol dehydrogenase family)
VRSLHAQVCLILGAAGGIGSAVVRRFVAEGATVVAVDVDRERLNTLVAAFHNTPAPHAVVADPGVWVEAERLVDDVVSAHGGIDVVVSCAGRYDQAVALVDVPGDRIESALTECVRANVTSALHTIRAALPTLAARRGRVVLTASYASNLPSGGGVFYTAAKHALTGVVKQLAYELAPHVRVNAVAPGVARTVMTGLSTLEQGAADAVLDGTEAALPLGVLPATDDYSEVYALLASPTASVAMTGSTVVVDSGLAVRGLARPSAASLRQLAADAEDNR